MSTHRDSPTHYRTLNRIEQHNSLDETSKQGLCLKAPTRAASSPLPPTRNSKSVRLFPVPTHSNTSTPRTLRNPLGRKIYSNQNHHAESALSSHFETPVSPKITTTPADELHDETASDSSFYQTPTGGTRSPGSSISEENPKVSSANGTSFSSKFIFDPISPLNTNDPNTYKTFEYYEPISPEECSLFCTSTPPPISPSFISLHRPSSLTTQPYFPVEMSSFASENTTPHHKIQRSQYNSVKRDSCITETTQVSIDSNDSTATSTSYDPFQTQTNHQKLISKQNSDFGDVVRHRRDAINIISNPGYQVLHSSHSTLDRTCSDSIVSLCHRKSTSDLTNEIESSKYTNALDQTINNKKLKRRTGSKVGLAYLASRRSSRDSSKSVCSNASIFSNDDIGPLSFQATNRGRQRRTSNFLELPVPDHIRPRVYSLPDRPYNPRISEDLYRLRHFSISKGNVVNCGDSIISRRSRSNTSVNSTNSRASERSPFDGSCCGGGYANVDSVVASPDDSDNIENCSPQRYRIVMLGDSGVGKTALVNQFMTSEYMHTYDASLDDEFGEKTVSVLLDNEESELVFIDHPSIEMSVENSLATYEPHGCVIVFSIVDKSSFSAAEEIINYLWQENYTKHKAVILVGNKADLARSRVISSNDGKSLAASRDAKFIETSSGIQHNVDELLVGILKQMRLKEKRDKKAVSSKIKSSKTHASLHLAKELLQKICLTDISKSKSCENLHVL